MSKIVTRGYLKDKFKDIEVALQDSDISYEFKVENIPGPEIKKDQTKKVNIWWKFAKISARNFGHFCKILISKIIIPAGNSIVNVSKISLIKLKESKENKEILLDDYLSRVELDLYAHEKERMNSEQKKISEISKYESEIGSLFSHQNCKINLSLKDGELEAVESVYEYNLALFELIAMKLKESRLDTNLHQIKIHTDLKNNILSNRIEFDLKKLGYKWATIFTKTIGVSIYNSIGNAEGSSSSKLVKNVTNDGEKLFFNFNYNINAYKEAAKPKEKSEALDLDNGKRFINSDINQ